MFKLQRIVKGNASFYKCTFFLISYKCKLKTCHLNEALTFRCLKSDLRFSFILFSIFQHCFVNTVKVHWVLFVNCSIPLLVGIVMGIIGAIILCICCCCLLCGNCCTLCCRQCSAFGQQKQVQKRKPQKKKKPQHRLMPGVEVSTKMFGIYIDKQNIY